VKQKGVISLKTNKIFIFLISIFLVLTAGCTNEVKNKKDGIKNQGDKIIVENRVGEANKYEYYNEIKDSKEVQKVKDILDNTIWENAKVGMAYPPRYRFHFEDTNSKSSGTGYSLWISPNKDKIELVIESASKYVQLNEQVSTELFKIVTGKELGSD
jgi:hypothetical protein